MKTKDGHSVDDVDKVMENINLTPYNEPFSLTKKWVGFPVWAWLVIALVFLVLLVLLIRKF